MRSSLQLRAIEMKWWPRGEPVTSCPADTAPFSHALICIVVQHVY